MGLLNSILDDTRTKQSLWYGHVQRMEANLRPKQALEWMTSERSKRTTEYEESKEFWVQWQRGVEAQRRVVTKNQKTSLTLINNKYTQCNESHQDYMTN